MISKVSEFVLKILGLGILSLCDGSNTSCELVSTMKTNLQGWQGNLISWPFLGVGIGWIGDSFEMFLFSQRHSISSDLPCSDLWLFVGVIFHLDDARWHRPCKLCKCNSTFWVASGDPSCYQHALADPNHFFDISDPTCTSEAGWNVTSSRESLEGNGVNVIGWIIRYNPWKLIRWEPSVTSQKHQRLISSTSCCCNDVSDYCLELPESTPCFCQSPWSVLQKSVGRTYQKPNVFPHFSHTNQHQPLGTGPRSLVPGSWTGQWRDRFFFPGGLKGSLIWSFSEDTDAFSIPLFELLWDMRLFGCI